MAVPNNALAALSQLLPTDLTTLPGTVTTAASTSVTTTQDLTPYLRRGDLVSFSGQSDVVYAIDAITTTTITLTIAYAGTTGAGQTIYKDSFTVQNAGGVTGTSKSVPAQSAGAGTVTATNGSTAVTGSGTSFNTLFSAGDGIIFIADNPTKVYHIRSVTSATALVLEEEYDGSTGGSKSYEKANFTTRRHDPTSTTNKGGRFGAMALGTSATAATTSDTGLGAEATTLGAQRHSGVSASTGVTTYLTSSDAGVSWKSTWASSWAITGTIGLNELGIFNDPVANRGICLIRQVFASQLDLVNGDILNLVVSLTHSATATATGVVPSIGLKEAAKLTMDNGTTAGTDSPTTPGSTWASVKGTQFDYIALGSGSTAPALGDVALVTEVSTLGTARQGTTSVIGQIMRTPTLANVFPLAFDTDAFTTVVGDTVQWRATFTISGGNIAIREMGIFNHSVQGNNDPTAGSRMLIRQVFAANLNLVDTDIFYPVLRLQST